MKYFISLSILIMTIVMLTACGGSSGGNVIVTGEQAEKMDVQDVDNDVCKEFDDDFVYTVTGKQIVRIEPPYSAGIFSCKYYTEYKEDYYKVRGETSPGGPNITIVIDHIPVTRHKSNMEAIGLKLETDSRIKMEHWVAKKDDNSIWEIGIPINAERFVWTNTLNKPLTDEEHIKLGIAMAEKIQNKLSLEIKQNPGITEEAKTEAQPESKEDTVREFFGFINDHEIDKALKIMDCDENTKQMWGVNFNSIDSLTIKSIEPAFEEEWTANKVTYKVQLDAKVKTDQYGWYDGLNSRWISFDGGWVHELANNP